MALESIYPKSCEFMVIGRDDDRASDFGISQMLLK
jgi:hypothetical protein